MSARRLAALGADAKEVRALRAAADRMRLRAVKDDTGRWLSTRQWVDDYRRTRRVGRPRKPRADAGDAEAFKDLLGSMPELESGDDLAVPRELPRDVL